MESLPWRFCSGAMIEQFTLTLGRGQTQGGTFQSAFHTTTQRPATSMPPMSRAKKTGHGQALVTQSLLSSKHIKMTPVFLEYIELVQRASYFSLAKVIFLCGLEKGIKAGFH